MKKEITVGQLLSVGATLLIALATGWVTMSNKVAKTEEKMEAMRAQWSQEKMDFKSGMEQLKHETRDINSKLTDILIKLENKKNRD